MPTKNLTDMDILDISATPKEWSFGPKSDNPFMSDLPLSETPSKPLDSYAKAVLADAMQKWYAGGRKLPFTNVPQQLDTGADQGVARLIDMMPGFPKINAKNWDAMLAGTEPSKNVEDRTKFDPTDFLPSGSPAPVPAGGWSGQTFDKAPNSLDTIIAGLNAPGGALQPVLSTGAGGRIDRGTDAPAPIPGNFVGGTAAPIADLVAGKGEVGSPLEWAMNLFGGPKLSPRIFAGRSPPVGISVTSPATKVTAGGPFANPIDLASQRSAQTWNTANEGGVAPTLQSTIADILAEKAAMTAPQNVVPIRPTLAKGNIRNQTADEMSGGNTADILALIQGALKNNPFLRPVP